MPATIYITFVLGINSGLFQENHENRGASLKEEYESDTQLLRLARLQRALAALTLRKHPQLSAGI